MRRAGSLLTILLLLASNVLMAYEEPEFELLASRDGYDVRRYAEYIVAEVDVASASGQAGNDAFPILAGYIFGDNVAAEKMNMTAPVESYSAAEGERMSMTAPVETSPSREKAGIVTYAFVMERKYSLETLPRPKDPRIRIVTREPRTMAVLRYGGRWTEENDRDHEQSLRAALARDGIEARGEAVLARYNSPFTPYFMRRNEVMVEVDWPTANPASEPSLSKAN